MKHPEAVITIGLKIRKLRNAKNYSQQELADYAEINKKTLQKIELGRIATNLDIIISIAQALGVQPHQLLE